MECEGDNARDHFSRTMRRQDIMQKGMCRKSAIFTAHPEWWTTMLEVFRALRRKMSVSSLERMHPCMPSQKNISLDISGQCSA